MAPPGRSGEFTQPSLHLLAEYCRRFVVSKRDRRLAYDQGADEHRNAGEKQRDDGGPPPTRRKRQNIHTESAISLDTLVGLT